MSNAEIGRIVGLTSPAVADRIKKMEDLGVIKGIEWMLPIQLRDIN